MGEKCDEGKRKEMRKISKMRKMRKKRKKGGKRGKKREKIKKGKNYDKIRGKNIILEREGGKNMIFFGKYIPLPVVGPRGLVGSPGS